MLALISLDAVAEPLFRRMVAQGRLPQAANLLSRGRTYRLAPTPLHASVYRSLYTGQSLSTHGAHYPMQWCAAEQRMKAAPRMRAEESIWTRLDRAGKRLLVIDPPEGEPCALENGLACSGWQFTARWVLPEWHSTPSLAKLLRARGGAPQGCHEVFGRPSRAHLREMQRVLAGASQRLAEATVACLRQGPFDLVWVTFAAPHLAGHQLWRDSLDDDSTAAGETPRLLAEIYERADEALGEVLAALPRGTDIILFSPHGMGPESSRADLLPGMLAKVLGQSEGAASPLTRLRNWVPTGVRARVAKALPERVAIGLTARLEHGRPDWRRVRAFAPASDGAGFVRLNLGGREREGVVPAGEAESLLREIAEGLATFGEPSGEKVVARVWRAEELDGAGPGCGALPDLVVEWSSRPEAGLRRVMSPIYGEVVREGAGSGRVGNHGPPGWACVVPAMEVAGRDEDEVVRPIDLAATACARLGVPHADLPGRPLLR